MLGFVSFIPLFDGVAAYEDALAMTTICSSCGPST
jgi:hypothetical protein